MVGRDARWSCSRDDRAASPTAAAARDDLRGTRRGQEPARPGAPAAPRRTPGDTSCAAGASRTAKAITYWPLAEILKGDAGVLDTTRRKLRSRRSRALGRTLLGDVPPIRRARPRRSRSRSASSDPESGSTSSKPTGPRRVDAAWRASSPALAAGAPALVVDRGHPLGGPRLAGPARGARRARPGPLLFAVPGAAGAARTPPGLGRRKAQLLRRSRSTRWRPTTPSTSSRLLAVDDLPTTVRRDPRARRGNPFFLEEIIRHLIDEGRSCARATVERARDPSADVEIPDTVQAVLAARIDCSTAVERSALLAAAVVGRVFWTARSRGLLDRDAERRAEALRRLEDRELCRARPGRCSPASASSSSSTSSRATCLRRCPRERLAAHARCRAPGSSRPRGPPVGVRRTARTYTSGSRTRNTSPPSRPLLRTTARRSGCDSSKRLRAPSTEAQSRNLCSTRRTRSARRRWTSPPTRASGHWHWRRSACPPSRDYGGDDSWRYLSQAVDEHRVRRRAPAGKRASRCCCPARSSHRRAGPRRCSRLPGPKKWGRTSRSASSTLRPKERRAFVSCSLARCGSSRLRRKGSDKAEADAARRRGGGGVRARGGARAGWHGQRGPRRSPEHRVHRRPARADLGCRRTQAGDRGATDRAPWEVGDALQTAADTALAVGRYEDARRWASEGFERARGGPDVWRAGSARRAIARFRLGDWDGASRTTSAWRRRAPRRASERPDTSR